MMSKGNYSLSKNQRRGNIVSYAVLIIGALLVILPILWMFITALKGWLKLNLSIGEIKLAPEDLLIEMARSDHYYSVEDGGITVAIETVLTDELVEEGFVREIISKLQTMRKEADFQVMDHIVIYVKGNEKIAGIMQKNLRVIENDTLADALKIEEMNGYAKEWDINGERVTLGVEQVKS